MKQREWTTVVWGVLMMLFWGSTSADETVEIISPQTGLTQKGCEYIFPSVTPSRCLIRWKDRLSYEERHKYFLSQGSIAVRISLQSAREKAVFEDLKQTRTADDTEQLQAIVSQTFSKEMVISCIDKQDVHPDLCLFLYEELATVEEMARVAFDYSGN